MYFTPVAIGVELPPPPPPPLPFSFGEEFPVPRIRSRWIALCDEEENCLDIVEKARLPGVVPFLVDAPLPAKNISLPSPLCLSLLLEPNATKVDVDALEVAGQSGECVPFLSQSGGILGIGDATDAEITDVPAEAEPLYQKAAEPFIPEWAHRWHF